MAFGQRMLLTWAVLIAGLVHVDRGFNLGYSGALNPWLVGIVGLATAWYAIQELR